MIYTSNTRTMNVRAVVSVLFECQLDPVLFDVCRGEYHCYHNDCLMFRLTSLDVHNLTEIMIERLKE